MNNKKISVLLADDQEITRTGIRFSRIKIWEENVGKKLEQLTTRETKVLNLLSEGADNKKIALDLNISIKTVAFHITHILTKLELKSRQEAALWARKNLLDNLE